MFDIILLKKYEGKLMPSGNPIQYQAAVTPAVLTGTYSTLYIQVTVKVEQAPGSGIYNLVKTEKLIPSADGTFQFDISPLCDPYLEYFVPPANLDNIVECTRQVRNFAVTIDLYWEGNNNSKEASVTDTVRVLKAGASWEHFLPHLGSLMYTNDAHWLLVSQLAEDASNNKETVFADDYFWLCLLLPAIPAREYRFRYGIEYLDVDDAIKTTTGQLHPNLQYTGERRVILFPAGYRQNALEKLIPEGATPIKYWFDIHYMVAATPTYGRLYPYPVFHLDQRTFYNTKKLVYRSSLGSLMPLTLRGQIENEAAYESSINNTTQLQWLVNRNVQPQLKQTRAQEDNRFKGETGLITRQEALRLRDFFLSDERYEYENGRLIPIVLNSKTAKLPSSLDNLHNVSLEWQHAFRNRFYTLPDPGSKACPALLNFKWQQYFNNSIQVFYWLPPGFNHLRVTVQFPGEEPQFYILEGNSGSSIINYARPESAEDTVSLSVKANVMCNRYNKVPSYGPTYITPDQDLAPALPLFAGADTFNLLPGITTPTVLSPSVLANDYDPAGAPIEVVAVTDQPTTAGGTISINAAGVVTYTPPSAGFTGADSFEYEIRNVGGTDTVTGTINFIVKASTNASIWASIGSEELVSSGFTFFYNKHYVNLWNGPGALVPVTGNNLTINYRRIVEVSFSTDNFASVSSTSTDLSVTINGASKALIFTGNLDRYDFDLAFTKRTRTRFEILPGTGYNVI